MDLKKILKSRQVIITLIVCIMVLILAIVLFRSNSGKKMPALDDQLALAQKYLEEMDYDNAILAFEAAIDIDPKCEEAYVGLASAYVGLEDYDKAAEVLNEGLKKVDEPISLHEKLVEIYLKTENYEKCIEELEILIELDGDNKEYYEQLIEIYEKEGMTEELIEFLNEIKDSEILQPEIYTILAEIYQEEMMSGEIIDLLEPLQEEDFFDKKLTKILAEAYQDTNMDDKAIEVLEKSVENGDADGEVYYILADLYNKKGETAKAEDAAIQSIKKYNSETDTAAKESGLKDVQKLLEKIQKNENANEQNSEMISGFHETESRNYGQTFTAGNISNSGSANNGMDNSGKQNTGSSSDSEKQNQTVEESHKSETVSNNESSKPAGKPEETPAEQEGTITEPEETPAESEGTTTEPEETTTKPEETLAESEGTTTEPEETTTEPEETTTEPEETTTEPEETTTEPEEVEKDCVVNGSYQVDISSNSTNLNEEEVINLWKRKIGIDIADELMKQSDQKTAVYRNGNTVYVAFFNIESYGQVYSYSFELKNISSDIDLVFTSPGCTSMKYSNLNFSDRESIQMQEVRLLYDDISLLEKQVLDQTELRFTSAVDNSPVTGLSVALLDGWNNRTQDYVAQTTTNEDGYAVFRNIVSGYYTIEYSGEGYISGYENCYIPSEVTVSVSPKLEENQYRIVLRWGETPNDLDLHCSVRAGENSSHVFYSNRRFEYGDNVVELDTDDTNSYGPETITFTVTPNSSFSFYVHNYSSNYNTELSLSGATVTLYQGDSDVPSKIYRVPTNQTGYYWNIFRIDNGVISEVNEISYSSMNVQDEDE